MVPKPNLVRDRPPEAQAPTVQERVIKRVVKQKQRGVQVTTWVIRTAGWQACPRGCWARCKVVKRVLEDRKPARVKVVKPWAQRNQSNHSRFRLRVKVDGVDEYLGRLAAWAFWPQARTRSWAQFKAAGMEGDHLPFPDDRARTEASGRQGIRTQVWVDRLARIW